MNKANIGILTIPLGESGIIPLSNLIKILRSLANEIYLVTGNEGYTYFKDDKSLHVSGVMHERGANPFTRVLKYFLMQLQLSQKLISARKNVDLWIFFFCGDGLILPMLTAKILRKKVILGFPSYEAQVLKSSNDNFHRAMAVLSNINCRMADIITIYSNNHIQEWGLEKYNGKIMIAHEHILDFDRFKVTKPYDEREMIVGYIGRFYEEKGATNFMRAIPGILKARPDIKFIIAGDGGQRGDIEKFIIENSLSGNVILPGWIPHDTLADYLNDLKLLVLPSYTEGLPNIMLEAMACGTPVLATPVGAIPDIISNNINGYILKDNSPTTISNSILSVISNSDKNVIIDNAKKLINDKYAYASAVDEYAKIMEKAEALSDVS